MIKLFRNKKKKAIAFVDYEYWFYSCKEMFNLYPNLQRWKDEIAKRFELKDIMVFGDFSHENIAGDLHKVRSITNTVIETSNTFMRKKKDMTDFIMLDYIYQTLEQQKGIDTYILFTGDGHFQTVVKCLKEKKKRVIVCGIEDSFMLDKYCRKASIEKKRFRSFHSLRRAFGTELAIAEVPVTSISQMLGHKDMSSDKAYLSFNRTQTSLCAADFSGVPITKGVYANYDFNNKIN